MTYQDKCIENILGDKPFLPKSVFPLSNYNWTRTDNHLVHKRTLNHLAKLFFRFNVVTNLHQAVGD